MGLNTLERVKSTIDIWFRILIWLTVIILIIPAILVPEGNVYVLLCILPIIAFLLWIYFNSWYELRDEYLYCVCGPFREKIAYDKIKSARLATNLLSSMALSSKRIEIRQHGKGYFAGTTMISPKNREAFLEELKKRCYNLENK